MVSNLMQKLPIEVRRIILSLVPQQELLSIRKVSDDWFCTQVIDYIISANRGTVSIIFEQRSLEAFLQICDIARFTPQVHTLRICMRHILSLDERRHFDDTEGVEDDADNDRDAYGTWASEDSLLRLNEQCELMRNYAFLKCFQEALQTLTICKTIVFTDGELPRDVCSPAEDVDPSHYHGLVLNSGDSIAFVTKSLDVVLNGPNLPHLEAITFDIGQFSVKDRDGLKPTMLPSLSGLVANVRRLSLNLDHKFIDTPDLRTFVSGFPELQELRLEVADEDWMFGTLPFLSNMAIPKLRKLNLEWLACEMHELNNFLLQHQDTSSHIVLDRVFLHGTRSWDRIHQALTQRLNLQEIVMKDCGIASDEIAEA
ncbi:hypothetical protein FSARC_14476 [Fusarium sarcochroum]|uniref:F-box domain-containing protein n=1 Tax=Fusarium sarcochroum TaxID=1208366 RepID=A0A8H4ST71_9HYPO|nr:hypothetical protein FSARC_14476 [Fusarium sarcochroum]